MIVIVAQNDNRRKVLIYFAFYATFTTTPDSQ